MLHPYTFNDTPDTVNWLEQGKPFLPDASGNLYAFDLTTGLLMPEYTLAYLNSIVANEV